MGDELTKKELAQMLDGREYGHEMTKEIREEAKKIGVVIVYGVSDDLVEFDGAWSDEASAYPGEAISLDLDGVIGNMCDSANCVYYAAACVDEPTITPLWCAMEVPGRPAWAYKTSIPHETFQIMEEGEVYCRGIVFSVKDLSDG